MASLGATVLQHLSGQKQELTRTVVLRHGIGAAPIVAARHLAAGVLDP